MTLDPDVRALVEQAMAERGVSFKTALNDAVRAGLRGAEPSGEVRTAARPMGARIDLTHANRVVADLEDAEILRKMALGK